MTAAELIAAGVPTARAQRWLDPINAAMREFGIGELEHQAAFLGQISHESLNFARTAESFDYSVDGLRATFGKRIEATAAILGRQPGERAVPPERQRSIASIVYAGRYGNGDSSSGDGWTFRGGGLKQITFHDNYAACGQALGVNLLQQPELLMTDDVLAARSAAWFWYAINGNGYIQRGDFDGLSTRINGAGISQDSLLKRRAKRVLFRKALGLK